MVKQAIDIPQNQREKIVERLSQILRPHDEIYFSYVFGSFVENIPFKDIDIAVYYAPELYDKLDVLKYEQTLADEISSDVKIPVDIRIINNAPLGFMYAVTCGRVLTSRNEEFRCDLVERIWIEYLDYQPKAAEFLHDMFPIVEK